MWSIEKYAQAWEFATIKHMGQTYGGRVEGERIPYINHLASVAAELLWAAQYHADIDIDLALQCGILHDSLEDTSATFEDVQARFGDAVAMGVFALTKDPAVLDRSAQMQDSLRRIKQLPKEIWMVKLADRITNLYHPPYYWDDGKIEWYRSESRSILAALGSSSPVLGARLAEKIAVYGGQ